MLKIITAIGNDILNKRLKEIENYNVITDDLKQESEILDWLEREENIDVLILCSKIINNYSIDDFIELVKELQEDIKIIWFNLGIENIENMNENDMLKIYTTFDIDWSMLKNELEKNEKVKVIEEGTAKIIAVTGSSGIGKSTFSTFFAKSVDKEKEKILLIDFDLEQNCLRTLLKIKKYPRDVKNIKDRIIKIDKNFDVLYNLDEYFFNLEEFDFLQVQKILNELKHEYSLIIIDTSSKIELDYVRRIFYNSSEILFLIEPNILGVKKAHKMLEVFTDDWNISERKIKLVLNKANMYQISDNVIEELFKNYELIGKIKYNDLYNLMINKDICKNEIKKEYQKIYEKV